MEKDKGLIDVNDNSKKIRPGAEFDARTGNINIGSLFGLRPYEKGYCCLAVMSTPKVMRMANHEGDNRSELLKTFVDILELEFVGISGIEDQVLETNDVSNNILNLSLIIKNNRNINTTLDMTFSEKTGTPITKFMDMYSRFTYDPYTHLKTYGGRLNTNKTHIDAVNAGQANSMTNCLPNECFNLLYIVTDNTGFLVEKAFMFYNARPLNTPFSTLYNMNKFEVEKAEVNLQWITTVIDGPAINRIATVYTRTLMMNAIENGFMAGSSTQIDLTESIYTAADLGDKGIVQHYFDK